MGFKRQFAQTLARIMPHFWKNRVQNPIFIIGTARSGTSLLRNLVQTHPQIADWSEANVVWDPTGYPSPPHQAPDWVDPHVFNQRWYRDAQHRLDEIAATFGVFQTLRRKPYFLNKSPFNTFRIPHILQMFPQAKFIHIVRNGLAVVNSRLYKNADFIDGMPYRYPDDDTAYDFDTAALAFARLWRLSVQEVQRQDERYHLSDQGNIYHTTYETLVSTPDAVLQDVGAFIGIDPTQFTDDLPRIDNRNYKWRDKLSPQLVAQLVDEMQPTFDDMGYTS